MTYTYTEYDNRSVKEQPAWDIIAIRNQKNASNFMTLLIIGWIVSFIFYLIYRSIKNYIRNLE